MRQEEKAEVMDPVLEKLDGKCPCKKLPQDVGDEGWQPHMAISDAHLLGIDGVGRGYVLVLGI